MSAAYVSSHSYNLNAADLVSVIASFDTDGHIRPLYVRISGEPLKVHTSWLKPSFGKIMEFHCKVIDHDRLKPLVLDYHSREGVWTTPKDSGFF